MSKIFKILITVLVSGLFVNLSAYAENIEVGKKPQLDTNLIPSPVFDAEPGYTELYWTAWKQAYEHVKYQSGLVQPLYMDEGLWDDTIWIWDSEFMAMYCKYAPKIYPGIQTLDNFYYTMLEDKGSSLRIQHPDNPPFFAWIESEYYKFTGDKAHIQELIHDKRFLQRYFHLFDSLSPEKKLQFDHHKMALRKKALGYNWNGISSGMDNTPRARAGQILWVDAIAQQALSALYISRLAKKTGDKESEREFTLKYNNLKEILNSHYWDDKDKCYYDIDENTLEPTRILSPASFWPVLAEIPSKEQVREMVAFAMQDTKLGGEIPWVTISRDDKDFNSKDGNYWQGAVWLPTSYIAIKSLEKYGLFDVANSTAEKILSHQLKTYREYEPHTIWECYSPVLPEPSSNHGERVRADFCGWSALGPISLFIENVLGFYNVDAEKQVVSWNLHQTCRHGIERLSFGDISTSIVYDKGKVSVDSNKPYVLEINGRKYRVDEGKTVIKDIHSSI